MIKSSNILPTAENEHTLIWRYMSLAKFLSCLSSRTLWFSGLDNLARTDPHEGELALPNFKHRDTNTANELTDEQLSSLNVKFPANKEGREDAFQTYRKQSEYKIRRRQRYRRTMFVNCWHMNTSESAGMWATYAPGTESIAIVSQYRQLESSFPDNTKEVLSFEVDYKDFLHEEVLDEGFRPYPITKRRSYSYEQELRLIYVDELEAQREFGIDREHAQKMFHLIESEGRRRERTMEEYNFDAISIERPEQRIGIAIPCEYRNLIREVRIAPYAPSWVTEAVKETCLRFDISPKLVHPSEISSPKFG